MPGLVSVIMPTYNQAHFLPEALEGVFAQDYPHFELIVVDDGSTDDTARLLDTYRKRHDFVVISQSNQRLPGALNSGFRRAQGNYLTWTSSDNIMSEDMLSVLVSALEAAPHIGLVYADRHFMDDFGTDLGLFPLPDYDPYLLLHTNLVHCCFLYRRQCMERVGLYDPEFIYGEDWEYWIRISRYYAMKHISQNLYRYRLHQNSMTSDIQRGTAQNMSYQEFVRPIRKRMPARWWIGRFKWRWLRLTQPNHLVFTDRRRWARAARIAGNPTVIAAAESLESD